MVGGNQPAAFQRLVEQLALPVDLVTSSGELGADKPDPEFYRRVAARVGVAPGQCVHVGDRVDNDVVGARAAGMVAVHLRRGPWGVLHAGDPALDAPGVHRLEGLDGLPELLRQPRDSPRDGRVRCGLAPTPARPTPGSRPTRASHSGPGASGTARTSERSPSASSRSTGRTVTPSATWWKAAPIRASGTPLSCDQASL